MQNIQILSKVITQHQHCLVSEVVL